MKPDMRSITIEGPAGKLEGVVHLPEACAEQGRSSEPRAIAVVAHPLTTMGGTMDNKIVTTLAKTFAELGFAALRFNFRGAGASEGMFDEGGGEVEDALIAAQHMVDQFGQLPMILAGFSFGGYVQARAAERLHPKASKLVLIAPAVGRFAPSTELRTGPSTEFRTGMPHVPHNTLLIHGEQDEVIPLSNALDWARPQHLPVVVLPEAGHFFHGRLNQIKQIVLHEFSGCDL